MANDNKLVEQPKTYEARYVEQEQVQKVRLPTIEEILTQKTQLPREYIEKLLNPNSVLILNLDFLSSMERRFKGNIEGAKRFIDSEQVNRNN